MRPFRSITRTAEQLEVGHCAPASFAHRDDVINFHEAVSLTTSGADAARSDFAKCFNAYRTCGATGDTLSRSYLADLFGVFSAPFLPRCLSALGVFGVIFLRALASLLSVVRVTLLSSLVLATMVARIILCALTLCLLLLLAMSAAVCPAVISIRLVPLRYALSGLFGVILGPLARLLARLEHLWMVARERPVAFRGLFAVARRAGMVLDPARGNVASRAWCAREIGRKTGGFGGFATDWLHAAPSHNFAVGAI